MARRKDGFWVVNTVAQNVLSSDPLGTWNSVMSGSTGDGNWHCYEFHVRSGNPGILQAWIDNREMLNDTASDVGTHSGWNIFVLATNQDSPANGADAYLSYDDVALSLTGRIGPLSSADGTVPSIPAGFAVE
jgi:hypothetical protein